MALFCTEYLLSIPFHVIQQDDELRGSIRAGYYAFQDYAVSYWFSHIYSAVTILGNSIDTHERLVRQFKSLLEEYGIPDQSGACLGITELRNLTEVLHCIPLDARSRNQWFDLERRTSRIRHVIEELREKSDLNDANEVLTQEIYGTLQYKCPKIWCTQFNIGFESRLARDKHLNRHDRPFRCVERDCPFEALGFETETQLQRHVSRNHARIDINQFEFPQPTNKKGDTLYKASARGDVAAVKCFLDGGENVHATSRPNGGETPLILAARNCQLQVCKMLLEGGADVNFKGPRGSMGSTALHAAVSSGDIEIVHYILSLSNVLPDQRNRYSQSPLHIAAEANSEEVVKLLLATGKVDPDAKDNFHRTPLSRAAGKGAEAVVKLLLATGKVDPEAKEIHGQTPLNRAAEKGAEAVVKLLLATGKVDPDAKDNYHRTPLSRAAEEGAEAVVKLLLATDKVDPEAKDNGGRTPLSRAAEEGAEAAVKLLLATGKVDPDVKDYYGQTPLWVAARVGGEAVVKLLLATGKVDPEAKDNSGRTPLSRAAEKGAEAVVKLLLATNKVDPDAKDEHGQTPLWLAAEMGKVAVVKLLLATSKVNPDARDTDGQTPLSRAKQQQQQQQHSYGNYQMQLKLIQQRKKDCNGQKRTR
jgi:ankyrin repeat protein